MYIFNVARLMKVLTALQIKSSSYIDKDSAIGLIGRMNSLAYDREVARMSAYSRAAMEQFK